MTGHDLGPIRALAQRCATSNLPLKDARALFEALYLADAMALANGNRTKAGERAGLSRVTINRKNARRSAGA